MSREEAVWIYLDVLLGFRGEYRKFHEATQCLTERDMLLVQVAVRERGDISNERK